MINMTSQVNITDKGITEMNDKFFELTREKQDRMINGAIRVFAENGYKHASTDDMVKAVGVSKGLWFHYFGNKIGLYEFMCEYAVRYFCMELSTAVDNREKNCYKIVLQMVGAVERVMKVYPYLPFFMYRLSIENDMDAAEVTVTGREKLQSKMNSLLKNAEFVPGLERKDREYMSGMLLYTLQGILLENYHAGEFVGDKMIKDMKEYIKKFQSFTASFQVKQSGEEMADVAS